MAYDPMSVSSILPYGPQLKSLLWSSSLTEADLRRFLRKKGVFVNYDEKKELIPLLSTTILAPNEFEDLREMHTFKEEAPRRVSTLIDVNGKVDFGKVIDSSFDITSLVNEEFSSYSFVGVPTFQVMGNVNETLELQFEVEHYDPSRNWFQVKTVSKGSIKFEANPDGSYRISSTQTSKEVESVNRSVIKYVKDRMRVIGVLGNENKELKTCFNSFTNEKRIAFLLDILFTGTSAITFSKITDIDVKPVEGVKLPDTPEVKWMQDRIKQLRLHGNGLENTFFVDSQKYHSCLIFPRIEADCNFDADEAEGICSVSLNFADAPRKEDSDLEITVTIKRFLPKKNSAKPQKVRDVLLNEIDKLKSQIFINNYPCSNKEQPLG